MKCRSKSSPGQWLGSLLTVLAGLAFLSVALLLVLASSNESGAGTLWFYATGLGVGGAIVCALGLRLQPEITHVVLDVPAQRITVRMGRPLLKGLTRAIPLSEPTMVHLIKKDVLSHRSRISVGGGAVSKSRHFHRQWRVTLDGLVIFWTLEEEQARRLAESIAAAAGIRLRDETGADPVRVSAEDLDLPLVERLARGDVRIPPTSTVPSGIERTLTVDGVRYAGRTGARLFGRYWKIALRGDRLAVKVTRFGIGWTRWLPLDEIEHLHRDHRLYSKSRGLLGRGTREQYLLRVVSDRRVLQVPLNEQVEASWLAGRILKDLRDRLVPSDPAVSGDA